MYSHSGYGYDCASSGYGKRLRKIKEKVYAQKQGTFSDQDERVCEGNEAS